MQLAGEVLESKSTVEREAEGPDGRVFLVRCFPYKGATDKSDGVVINLIDVTARRDAERNREWLAAVVESSNDAIVGLDAGFRIVSWNRGAEQIFGFSRDEATGRSWHELLEPAGRPVEGTLAGALQGAACCTTRPACCRRTGPCATCR